MVRIHQISGKFHLDFREFQAISLTEVALGFLVHGRALADRGVGRV